MDSHQNQPKTGLTRQGNGQNSCCLHFCFTFVQIDFEIFDEYFLKWTWILSSLTSITYRLTPSISNLFDAMAMASKQLFTMRSLHVWGRWYFQSFRARAFVSDSLIGYEIDIRPIKNTVSLRCHSVVWFRDLSQLRDHWAFDMTTDREIVLWPHRLYMAGEDNYDDSSSKSKWK